MAITDDIEKTRREIAGASTPGAQPAVVPAMTGATPAPRLAPRPAAGTIAGQALRTGVGGAAAMGRQQFNNAAAAANRAVADVTAVPRAGLGFARDAGRAFSGAAPAPTAGQPVPLPRFAPSPRAAAPALTPAPAPGAARPRPILSNAAPATPRADFSGVSARVDSTAGFAPGAPPAAAASTPAAASSYTTPDGRAASLPAGVTRTVDANGNPVFTASGEPAPGGATPPVAARPQAAQAAVPAQPVVAPRPTPVLAQRGRQGAVIENPHDTTVDKLTRAMGSASLRGSPSGRAAVAQAILGEAGARQAERMQTLQTQDAADLAAGQANAVAAEGDANRQLQARTTTAQLADNAVGRQSNLEAARLARRPEVSVAADGSMGIVDNDGSWRPVTGADGAAIRAPQAPRQTGELTDGERLKSYTDRYNAIVNGLGKPEEKEAALASLDADPLYAGLRGGTAAPAVGAVVDGFRFKGGDPADEKNWERTN